MKPTDQQLVEAAAELCGLDDAEWNCQKQCVVTAKLPGFRCYFAPRDNAADLQAVLMALWEKGHIPRIAIGDVSISIELFIDGSYGDESIQIEFFSHHNKSFQRTYAYALLKAVWQLKKQAEEESEENIYPWQPDKKPKSKGSL